MATILHPETRFKIGDPDRNPLPRKAFPSREARENAFKSLILSASGFRKVFAASGKEDSLEESVAPADLFLAAVAAFVFAEFLKTNYPGDGKAILLGMDSRPTGPAIADVMARVFIASDVSVRYLFIAAAPEIMAYARYAASLSPGDEDFALGFCYVSASHNPPGCNGMKFGLGDGGVLGPEEAEILIRELRKTVMGEDSAERIASLCEKTDSGKLVRAYGESSARKRKALSVYTHFTREVVSGIRDPAGRDRYFAGLAGSLRLRPLGIVAEMNGSARSLSIDVEFLESAGIKVFPVNNFPRSFAHRIVPEGASLDLCRAELEKAHARDKSYLFGYVPDCDGDRGNIVYLDTETGGARILEAQEVFALCCVAEMGSLVSSGNLSYDEAGRPLGKFAIAVNDPTSMRIDRIAGAFGAEVRRAEVGEANVVKLARELRKQGYTVRILGEGSNGGNITHPSAVRDPIDTLFAMVKLFAFRGGEKGVFRAWLGRIGKESAYESDFSFADIIATLPSFATTSVFEERALVKIRSSDQIELKRRYQRIFLSEWKIRLPFLVGRFGLSGWEAIGYKGIEERRGLEDFADSGRGGLKILLKNDRGEAKAFIWMRGSGTEPVFRIMADFEGSNPEAEAYLLSWQRELLENADEA